MLGPLWIRRCISAQGHCRAASAVDLSGPREFPPSSRRGARGLRNICVGSSRLQKLQGTDIRGAPARLQNFRREAAHASKYVHWGLKGFKESQGGCSGGKARERRFFRRLRSVLQNVCGGAGRTFKTSAVGRCELQDICSALFRGFQKSAGRFTGLDIFCCSSNCEKSRAERASRKLEQRQIFPRGEGSTYLRRSCPCLQNFRAARASIYLRRVLQGLQKIRRALVRPLGILRGKQKLWKVSS